ncbi:LmbE family N-acetylglucosaminyl deacetylase [Pedobacter sp. UYEF25]
MKINLLDKKSFFKDAEEIFEYDLDYFDSCLVLAPHPDDESLGCGGLIALFRSKNIKVNVVVTTDGSQSHPNSKAFPAKKITEIRKEEVRNALKILGVSSKALHFLDGVDSSLPTKGHEGFNGLKKRLIQLIVETAPTLILVPYELDPHCDHRATWQLLNEALGNDSVIKVWEYPIWLYELAGADDIPKLGPEQLKKISIEHFLVKKKQAIECHISQTTRLIADDLTGFMLLPEVIAHFLSPFEYFFDRR